MKIKINEQETYEIKLDNISLQDLNKIVRRLNTLNEVTLETETETELKQG